MERGRCRRGNACRAARLKLMGQSEGAADTLPPPPSIPILIRHTCTRAHIHTHLTSESIIQFGLSNDQWIRLPEVICLLSPTVRWCCFPPFCILRGSWHPMSLFNSGNVCAWMRRILRQWALNKKWLSCFPLNFYIRVQPTLNGTLKAQKLYPGTLYIKIK